MSTGGGGGGAMTLGEGIIQVRASIDALRGDFNRAEGMLQAHLGRTAGQAGRWANQVSRITSGVLIASGLHAVIDQVQSLGQAFLKNNATYEQHTIALGVMLRSETKAVQLMRDVESLANKTPFTTESLLRGVQLLKAYGFELQEIMPMMRTIGDAASASPLGMENAVMHIAMALGQIKAKGVAASEEIGKQLTNAGIPAWQMLAKGLNTDVAGAMALVKSRAVDANTAIRILLGGMDEMYGGMMEKQSRSFEGLQSTLTDVFRIFTRKAGASLFEGIKVDMGKLVDFGSGPQLDEFLDRVAPKITDFTMAIYRSTKAIGEFLVQNREIIVVLAELGAAALIAVKSYRAFNAIGMALTAAGGGLGALNPVAVLAAAGVAALAKVFADATAKGLTLNEALEDLMANLTGLGGPNLQGVEAKKIDDRLDSIGKTMDKAEKETFGTVTEEPEAEKPKVKGAWAERDEIFEAGNKAAEGPAKWAKELGRMAATEKQRIPELNRKASEAEKEAIRIGNAAGAFGGSSEPDQGKMDEAARLRSDATAARASQLKLSNASKRQYAKSEKLRDEAMKKKAAEVESRHAANPDNRKAIVSDATGIWDQLKAIAVAAQPKLQDAAIAGRADLEARQEALGLSPGTAKRNAKKKKEENDEIKRVAALRGVDPAVVRKEIEDSAQAARKELGLGDADIKGLQKKKDDDEAIDRVAKRWKIDPADIRKVMKEPKQKQTQITDAASFHSQLQMALNNSPAEKAQVKMQQQLAPVPELIKAGNMILGKLAAKGPPPARAG